jgi:hypothetical protein
MSVTFEREKRKSDANIKVIGYGKINVARALCAHRSGCKLRFTASGAARLVCLGQILGAGLITFSTHAAANRYFHAVAVKF